MVVVIGVIVVMMVKPRVETTMPHHQRSRSILLLWWGWIHHHPVIPLLVSYVDYHPMMGGWMTCIEWWWHPINNRIIRMMRMRITTHLSKPTPIPSWNDMPPYHVVRIVHPPHAAAITRLLLVIWVMMMLTIIATTTTTPMDQPHQQWYYPKRKSMVSIWVRENRRVDSSVGRVIPFSPPHPYHHYRPRRYVPRNTSRNYYYHPLWSMSLVVPHIIIITLVHHQGRRRQIGILSVQATKITTITNDRRVITIIERSNI